MFTLRSFTTGFAALAATAAASAQSFNVDFGTVGTPPASTYGAAAAQPGIWNEIEGGALGTPLVGLGGTPTAVTIETTGNSFTFNNAATTGDDEALLDSLLDGPTSIIVRGLAAGDYVVYTYAWAPDSAAYITNVEVLGSTDPLQACGGDWTGTFQLGIHYTRHAVTLGGTLTDLEIQLTTGSQFRSSNGIQIVRGGGGIGLNYCTANPNSTGATGVISATGSASVGANNLTLVASALPNNAFGFFITSPLTASIPNPGGSAGVLCVGSPIGRYVGAGQIKNTGTTGSFSLLLNLTQIPTPTGPTAAVAGQTRNFQAWHRDVVGGTATSNFTNGIAVTFAP